MPKDKKRLVLIDAHAIIHRAYHALPDFTSSKGEPTGGLYGLSAMLLKLLDDLKPDYIIACYDLPEPTFRHKEYKDYKAGRAKADDALVAQLIRSKDVFHAFHIPIYEKSGFEADDIIGTIVEKVKKTKDLETIIASGDMDTLQLVRGKDVVVYTLKKGLSETTTYDEAAVKERFGFPPELLSDYKGLRGDPSDNIPGIAGIGEKTGSQLVANFGTLEEMYKKLKKDEEAFRKAGIKERIIGLLREGEDDALFSKALATIRRDAPIDFSLPKATWREDFSIEKIEKLFSELSFRTLTDRAKRLFGGREDAPEEILKKEEVPDEEIKKTGIALWVLRSDITSPGLEDILRFAETNSFEEARKKIFEELKREKLESVYETIELPLVPIVDSAEKRGILIDTKYLKNLSDDYHKKLSAHEKKIWEHAGGEFNINSPKQLGEILFDKLLLSVKGLKKTAGGARSTRESELHKLKDVHPIISEILDYRELQKLLSTYIDSLPTTAGSDGRIHTSLRQAGTTTGRMSSINPNLQNIPASDRFGKAVRNAFVAAEGFLLLAFDYSQIEMRVLAELSEDDKLLDVFQKKEDVHSAVAATMYGVRESDVTKDMRRAAKVINFGIIYGMGVNALRENLGGTRAEAEDFYQNYFRKFPKIGAYFENVKREARKNGYTETLFGRRRYFPEMRSSLPYVKAQAERMAMNAPLQGTAADIVKIAMKEGNDALLREGLQSDAFLILQVHDELIFEVKKEALQKVVPLLKKAMEKIPKIKVPLEVNVSSGERWGELTKM